jgi:alkylation response protein AidB-like acyl-CoA dehydrogenase
MKQKFPTERAEKRRALLQAVDNVRDILAANAEEAEAIRTLPQASVAALRESGLFTLKLPAVLGGAEADPVTQIEVIEAVSYIDPATGWSFFIGTGGGSMCAFWPDEAIAQMFRGGRIPTLAGAFRIGGKAVAVDGGYRVTGRWSWASGIRHAEWVAAHVLVERPGSDRPEPRIVVVPASDLTIHDTWHVAGLKGTGSCDFSLTDCFVPEGFTFDSQAMQPQRGGPLYQLGLPGLLVNELAGFALGVSRRALDAIIELAHTKRRGYGKQTPLAERAVFQRVLGESDLRLRAARGLIIETFEKAWQTVCTGRRPEPALQVEMSSATTWVTDVALEVTTQAFRYGGGTAIHLNHILQRCLRDLQVGASHLMVSDASYERHGQCLLGLPGVDPMG